MKHFGVGLLIYWWPQEEGWLLKRHRDDSNVKPNTCFSHSYFFTVFKN